MSWKVKHSSLTAWNRRYEFRVEEMEHLVGWAVSTSRHGIGFGRIYPRLLLFSIAFCSRLRIWVDIQVDNTESDFKNHSDSEEIKQLVIQC